MIRTTLKEICDMNWSTRKVQIKLTADGIEYWREEIPVYVLRVWKNDDYREIEFKSHKAALRHAARNHIKTFDINYYKDIKDRYWSHQWQYVSSILIAEEEQDV